MIPLSTHGKTHDTFDGTLLGRVTRSALPRGARRDSVLVVEQLGEALDLVGYEAVLTSERDGERRRPSEGPPLVWGVKVDHLDDGDVVGINPNGFVRTLYRKGSRHNTILVTDQCNSYCLMCSQPPKPRDDRDRMAEHLRLVDLIDPTTEELGLTGGEPTLFEDDFLRLIDHCRARLPFTGLHVLTNGRIFRSESFAAALAGVSHPDLMLGIPVYSDIDWIHDHVVQAKGAFDETIRGLHNLARHGVRVEIRVVIHRLTIERLLHLVEFIYRNLTFAEHVALMGLEIIGFAAANLAALWIDPYDYRGLLAEATEFLAARGMTVSIYNHPLCVVPKRIWPYCRQSISDWKNEFLPVCAECAVRESCGGFFSSAVQKKHSSHILPVP